MSPTAPRIPAAMLALLTVATVQAAAQDASKPCAVSGIYPHLAFFNNEAECGTGAVVPWADRLWVITYGPHLPTGSSDKLYEITPDLRQIVRPESIGGTPANRMIHRESQQLIIGPYFIDAQRNVRAIPYSQMPGRHTGNARHLTDPVAKVYFATMEEGLYEVDVKTLAVCGLIRDGNFQKPLPDEKHPAPFDSQLPGYHGKGLYAGQGRLVYANNGERDPRANTDPTIPSGALAQWSGQGDWSMVRRNQFTEVTGPGGIYGNEHPDTDPIWTIGWDHRSLILMVLDRGQWHSYRLPKASHTYDGSHGWNTEWPRIRDIGEHDLLMTMHGMFWRFPKTFSPRNSAGIAPRSTYLKVIGDFCRWNDQLVFGCDDTAKSEFINRRKAKGNLAAPGQSQSNLWFTDPNRINHLGAPLGRGAVWIDEPVRAGQWSDPFLLAGFGRRGVHLAADQPATFTLEVDLRGDSQWTRLREVQVRDYTWVEFPPETKGAWLRLRTDRDCSKATAFFHFSSAPDPRPALATGQTTTHGLLHARGDNRQTLGFATDNAYYELDADLKLKRTEDAKAAEYLRQNVAIPKNVLASDTASVLYVDEAGNRWRLPFGEAPSPIVGRVDREVCTERDLFNAGGTFYELPAENAGGFAKIRPIATHNQRVTDYCSYRGLLVISGASGEFPHIIRSDDGQVSLWVGVVDDLWQFGKPRGVGGPWNHTPVQAGVPSDPYLMTGYDHKSLTLSAENQTTVRVEIDVTGTGLWHTWQTLEIVPDRTTEYRFPDAFAAYWVRLIPSHNTRATARFTYR